MITAVTHPQRILPKEKTDHTFEAGRLQTKLEPCSWNMIVLKKNGARGEE